MPKPIKSKTLNEAHRRAQEKLKLEKELTRRQDKLVKQARKLDRQREQTKRIMDKQKWTATMYAAKMGAKKASATAKTIARNTATASVGTSAAVSSANASKDQLELAKLEAMLKGNTDGENAIDNEKTGGNGNSNPRDKNYYAGWGY